MRDIPTALAPTEKLAHPKVKKYANKLAKELGATVHRFYACEPCVNRVWQSYSKDSPNWLMGDWGLEIRCKQFSPYSLPARGVISVEFVEAAAVCQPESDMIVTLQLSARVMR